MPRLLQLLTQLPRKIPNSELDEEVARATKSAADKATAAEDPVMVFVETVENVEEM
jgi:hypothetical protein